MFKLIGATFILIQNRWILVLAFLLGVSERASSFKCFYCYYYRWAARDVGTRNEPITTLCTYFCARIYQKMKLSAVHADIRFLWVHCTRKRLYLRVKNYVQIHWSGFFVVVIFFFLNCTRIYCLVRFYIRSLNKTHIHYPGSLFMQICLENRK